MNALSFVDKKHLVFGTFAAQAEGFVYTLASSTWAFAAETWLKPLKSLLHGVEELRIFKGPVLETESLSLPKASFCWVLQVHQCEEVDSLMKLKNIIKLAVLLIGDHAQGGLVVDLQSLSLFVEYALWESKLNPWNRAKIEAFLNGQCEIGWHLRDSRRLNHS